LADAGLAREHDVLPLVRGLDELVEDALPRRGHPERGVIDGLVEGRLGEAEVAEPARGVRRAAHDSSSSPRRGLRPTASSSRASAGSKGTSMPLLTRSSCVRRSLALALASTRRSASVRPSCSTHGARSASRSERATVTTLPERKPCSSSHSTPPTLSVPSLRTRRR